MQSSFTLHTSTGLIALSLVVVPLAGAVAQKGGAAPRAAPSTPRRIVVPRLPDIENFDQRRGKKNAESKIAQACRIAPPELATLRKDFSRLISRINKRLGWTEYKNRPLNQGRFNTAMGKWQAEITGLTNRINAAMARMATLLSNLSSLQGRSGSATSRDNERRLAALERERAAREAELEAVVAALGSAWRHLDVLETQLSAASRLPIPVSGRLQNSAVRRVVAARSELARSIGIMTKLCAR